MSLTPEYLIEFVESLIIVIGTVVLCFLALISISVTNRKLRYLIAPLIGGAIASLIVNKAPMSLVGGTFVLYSLALVIVFRFGTELQALSGTSQQALPDERTGYAYSDILWFIALCVPAIILRIVVADSGMSDSGIALFGYGLVVYGLALGGWSVAILVAE